MQSILWRRTLRIPKRAICSGSPLRERNWTGSSQLAWPLLHILDGQMLDWQCLVACMHAKKKLGRPRRIWGSEEHPTAPVAQRMQRRRQPAATHSGRKRNTHSTAPPLSLRVPRPAYCVRMCSCQCSAARDTGGCRIPRPVCHEGYGVANCQTKCSRCHPSDSQVIKKVESQSRFGKEPSQPRKKQRRHAKSK